jgi:O-antigen/teichoic acid export membrane protein
MSEKYEIDEPKKLGLRARLQFLLRDSVVYGGAGALNKLLALVTFPILARHFSVSQYGYFDFFNVLITLLTLFFVFGLDSAFNRYFYERENTAYRKNLISQAIIFQVLISFSAVLLTWQFAEFIGNTLLNIDANANLLKLIILQVPFLVIINFTQNILKVTFARIQFLVISVGSTLFSVVGILIGIWMYELAIFDVFLIYLVVRLIFSLLGIFFCYKWMILPRSFSLLKHVMPFAIPYGIICTAGALMPALERVFINEYLQNSDLGLYAAGAKVALLINLPIQAFELAWIPFSFSLHKEKDAESTYVWVVKIYTIFIILSVIAIALLSKPLLNILASEKYIAGYIIVLPIALAFAFQSIGTIFSVGIDLSKKSYLKLYGYFGFLLCSVISMYFLVQYYGLVGVAWGALIGYISKAIIESALSYREYRMLWPFFGIIIICSTVLIFSLIYQVFVMEGYFSNLFFVTQ